MKTHRISLAVLLFCCLFLTALSFCAQKWNQWQSQKLIAWDISGYYMYLPGLFYTPSLGQLENRQYVIDTYHPCGNEFYANKCPTGNFIIKYSSGMALMYLPGFIAGHIYAKAAGYPVDGFSYPYQFTMAMYSLLISFLGLWISRKVLLLYFEDVIVAIALLTLCLASNYLNYSAICGMFSHNYLFTVYSAIIYLSIFWHRHPDYKKTIGLGLLCGLATLTRPTEIICLVIPALWGVQNFQSLTGRVLLFVREYRKVLVFGFCAILIGSLQLIYWKIYAGHFFYWSYGKEEGFNFLRVPVFYCLFGYKKGWFAYTPVMALSLIGFIPIFKYKRKTFYAALIFSFLALYITFSWKCWWYGGSFSLRAMVQYYSILVFPLCAFFTWAKRSWISSLMTSIFLLFCIWLNLVMTYQANGGGIMESDNMSKAYYWRIFGRIEGDRSNKKLIETDEEIPTSLLSRLTFLAKNSLCSDSNDSNCIEFENGRVFPMSQNQEYLPGMPIDISNKKGKWFRVSCDVYLKRGEDNYEKKPMLCAWLSDASSRVVKQKGYRIERVVEWNKWEKIWIDIYAPENLPVKYLRGGIYNPKGDIELLVRNVTFEYTK
jgi:hypothetical protein